MQGKGRVYVCGTCIDGNVRAALEQYNPIFYDGTPLEHFSFIRRFNRIILSNSTFAWWAAYLSDATEIFAPRISLDGVYSFSGCGDIDLTMRESRYHEYAVSSTVQMGVFRRNKHISVRHKLQENVLVIQDNEGIVGELAVHESDRELLDWILNKEQPMTMQELKHRYHGSCLDETLERFIKLNLLQVDAAYLDKLKP